MNKLKRAEELEYLKWIYRNMDFGPAHADVIESLNQQFEELHKLKVPKEYEI